MIDLCLRGAYIADGTGAPGRVGDVGVHDGRIVAAGRVDEPAAHTLELADLVIAPGFIDLHTHLDVQGFWDPTLSPSPLHGVTTVLGGNCGFSVMPLAADDGDYLTRMLAKVEGMPLESLMAGVPWDWKSPSDFLARLDGTLAANAGFLVGHSALRRAVMGDDAVRRSATMDEVEAMVRHLDAGLGAGAIGFSSSWSRTHNDHHGAPVPSRFATLQELLALCSALRAHEGTTLEFSPGPAFDREMLDVMIAMSTAADRPVNWNVLRVDRDNRDAVQRQLADCDVAASKGARVVPLTLPDSLRVRLNFKTAIAFDQLPGWTELMTMNDAEKLRALSDPVAREQLRRSADSVTGSARWLVAWGDFVLLETWTEQYRHWVGSSFAQIAAARGTSPWDSLADIVVADGLRTVFAKPDTGQDEESWRHRAEIWRDPRVVIGGSDAGAHVDSIDSFCYMTTLLAKGVREHQLLSVEEAVHLLTARPARLYGLRHRGALEVGGRADIVVFDLQRVAPGPVTTRFDLPGGAGRLYADAVGVEHVFVNGVEIVRGSRFTDARPGAILRSGEDTSTVTASSPFP